MSLCDLQSNVPSLIQGTRASHMVPAAAKGVRSTSLLLFTALLNSVNSKKRAKAQALSRSLPPLSLPFWCLSYWWKVIGVPTPFPFRSIPFLFLLINPFFHRSIYSSRSGFTSSCMCRFVSVVLVDETSRTRQGGGLAAAAATGAGTSPFPPYTLPFLHLSLSRGLED